jgi:hypothetical protein
MPPGEQSVFQIKQEKLPFNSSSTTVTIPTPMIDAITPN